MKKSVNDYPAETRYLRRFNGAVVRGEYPPPMERDLTPAQAARMERFLIWADPLALAYVRPTDHRSQAEDPPSMHQTDFGQRLAAALALKQQGDNQ